MYNVPTFSVIVQTMIEFYFTFRSRYSGNSMKSFNFFSNQDFLIQFKAVWATNSGNLFCLHEEIQFKACDTGGRIVRSMNKQFRGNCSL